MATIEGNVVYLERMMLPPGAEVEVQLQDVSRPDAMAAVLATVSMTPEGGPPYPFVIEYDADSIDPRMTYALRATIVQEERLMFTNTDYIDAFSGNPVEVLVRRVPEAVRPAGPSLEGQVWRLQTLEGEPAEPGAGGKPVDILFDAEAMRVSGFSGCNRYTGGYVREGDYARASPLSFTPMAGTMMACGEGDELERRYLELLGKVSAYKLEGGTLSLLAGGETVATFKGD
jgi:putative lipoprotein